MFSGVTATEVKTPSEPHLLYVMKALRDRLDTRAIDALWWLDTRDMICDAMTKGTLSREPLLKLWRTAMLEINGDPPVVWRSSAARNESKTITALALIDAIRSDYLLTLRSQHGLGTL